MGFMDSIKTSIKKATDEKSEKQKYLAEIDRKTDLMSAARSDAAYQALYKKSISLYQKVEAAYAVIRNTEDFHGDNSEKFVSLCEQYFSIEAEMRPYREKYDDTALYADPYKRLSMLYEKRGDFYNAALVCVRSINDGFPYDGPHSNMQSRLSRMIKKGKFEPSEEMKNILSEVFE